MRAGEGREECVRREGDEAETRDGEGGPGQSPQPAARTCRVSAARGPGSASDGAARPPTHTSGRSRREAGRLHFRRQAPPTTAGENVTFPHRFPTD